MTLVGDALDSRILEEAGVTDAQAAILALDTDSATMFATVILKDLAPDVPVIARVNRAENVERIHRAGADFVMSYASLGSNKIFNLLKRSDVLMLAEGLDIFRMETPKSIVGKTLAELAVRRETGCSVVAYITNGDMSINPDPYEPIPAGSEIIVVGNVESEDTFLKRYGTTV